MNPFQLVSFSALLLFACLPLLQANVNHEGVIGSSFYGITQDISRSVTNQVGPYADFAVPTKLNASADSNSLLAGEFTKLQASLSLDDGTLTALSSSSVVWKTQSPDLLIKDGFITAEKISKNARVSINATADGFSAILFIRLKVGSSTVDPVTDSSNNALSGSVELSQPGWKKSGWFGNYFEGENNWIHHQHHGWLYTAGNTPTSLWLWSPTQKWLWTGPEIYPHIFRNEDACWMYFIVQALPLKVYYNQSSKSLERAE